MRSMAWRMTCAVVAFGAGVWDGRDAEAQSSGGGSVPTLAPSPSLQTIQSNALLTATAIGAMPGMMGTTAGGTAPQSGVFGSPMAAPLLYSSMVGTSMSQGQSTTTQTNPGAAATQMGMMYYLANQQNGGGVGSGRLSGGRTAAQQRTAPSETQPSSNSKTRSSDRPGGLASRYFHRANVRPTNPRTYFNRRPGYFP